MQNSVIRISTVKEMSYREGRGGWTQQQETEILLNIKHTIVQVEKDLLRS